MLVDFRYPLYSTSIASGAVCNSANLLSLFRLLDRVSAAVGRPKLQSLSEQMLINWWVLNLQNQMQLLQVYPTSVLGPSI